MKQIYHLETCKTCQKALALLSPDQEVELIEIKSQGISKEALEHMAQLAGSYEALFSRRAILYRQRNLGEQQLSEDDYKSLILEHYTFLKRPVVVTDREILEYPCHHFARGTYPVGNILLGHDMAANFSGDIHP